jgi:Zn-dependent peptidase ImmA (M78 family)
MRVDVRPELLDWALKRAGLNVDVVVQKLPKFPAWMNLEIRPTLRQVEQFARFTYTPVGYLFLQEPPIERLPIPDFRTLADGGVSQPSPDLLDTLYTCQQRQEWYREYARVEGHEPVGVVGQATVQSDVVATAASMRGILGFNVAERRQMPTWTDALRRFVEQAEALGVLTMVSGVVGNNNRRKLNPREFRGFALVDDLAPLIFVNGADTKNGQMFTVAHELAHVWLGQSALSDATAVSVPSQRVEQWCNQVAAEFLVPLESLRAEVRLNTDLFEESTRLARVFKVSSLVILRRMHDAGAIGRDEMWSAYEAELARLRTIPRGSGGDFYLTQGARVSKRFARALVSSTLEGHTLYRDAFRLLGFSKLETFRELGKSLGPA